MNALCKFLQAGAVVTCLLVLSGCGGEQYTYIQENETKPGPGLLSGEDGVFTLYGTEKKVSKEEPKKPKP